jgi:cell division protein FtsZ
MPGLINVDFADVRTIMQNAGSSLMGIGTGSGENRASAAARMAISSPLLEVSIDGAKGILFNITGGSDLAMSEVDEAAKIITSAADPDANIIFGATVDENMVDLIKITVVATGFDEARQKIQEMMTPITPVAQFTPINNENIQPIMAQDQNEQDEVESISDQQDPEETDLDIPAFLRQSR